MKSGIPVSILVLADMLPEFLLGGETAIGGCGQLGVGEDNSGADLIFDLNIFTYCNRPEKMSADHAKTMKLDFTMNMTNDWWKESFLRNKQPTHFHAEELVLESPQQMGFPRSHNRCCGHATIETPR